MREAHRVIVIPGIDGRVTPISLTTAPWRFYGLKPVVYSMNWGDGKTEFPQKLRDLGDVIKSFAADGDSVSLIGCSAGGSVAINAFFEQKDKVHRVINVCGPLRMGSQRGLNILGQAAKLNRQFRQSVELCETNLENLSAEDLRKIMTVRAMFGDEVIPPDTNVLEGAYNTLVPTAEHIFTVGAALSFFSMPLIAFLKRTDS